MIAKAKMLSHTYITFSAILSSDVISNSSCAQNVVSYG